MVDLFSFSSYDTDNIVKHLKPRVLDFSYLIIFREKQICFSLEGNIDFEDTEHKL